MGTNSQLIVLTLIAVFYIVAIYRAKKGLIPKVRSIVALDVMDELIGRSCEMGQTVLFITGGSKLSSSEASMAVAGFSILEHVSEICGKYEVPIQYMCQGGIHVPVAQDIIKFAYTKTGHPEMYNDDMVYYVGENPYVFYAVLMNYIYTNKPAVNLMFGGMKYESFVSMGAGAVAGCVQAGGTPRLYYQPFLAACCDYCMIGDEIYAAAARIKGIPEELAMFRGSDIVKVMMVILIIISVALYTGGAGKLFERFINF